MAKTTHRPIDINKVANQIRSLTDRSTPPPGFVACECGATASPGKKRKGTVIYCAHCFHDDCACKKLREEMEP